MRGAFFKSVLILCAGPVGAQILTLIASPFLTRLYTPSDFGVFSVYVSILYILCTFSMARLDTVLILTDDNEVKHVAKLAFKILLFFSLFVGAFLFFCRFNSTIIVNEFIWLIPVGIFLSGIFVIFSNICLKFKKQSIIARTRLLQSFFANGFQLLFGFFSLSHFSLIFGQMLGLVFGSGSFVAAKDVYRKIFFNKKIVKLSYLDIFKKNKKIILFDLPSSSLLMVNSYLPAVLIAILFSPYWAGIYALSQKMFASPFEVVSRSLSASILAYAKEIESKVDSIKLNHIIQVLSLIGVVLFTGLAFLIYLFFAPIFGEKWNDGAACAAFVLLFLPSKFIFDILGPFFLAKKMYLNNLYSQIGVLFFRFLSLILLAFFFEFNTAIFLFSFLSSFIYLIGINSSFGIKAFFNIAFPLNIALLVLSYYWFYGVVFNA